MRSSIGGGGDEGTLVGTLGSTREYIYTFLFHKDKWQNIGFGPPGKIYPSEPYPHPASARKKILDRRMQLNFKT